MEYRIGICHIPLTLTKASDPLADQKHAWVERLNQMNLSVMYNGHLHDLMYLDPEIEAGTILTHTPAYSGKETNTTKYTVCETNFPSILVSKRGTAQILSDAENFFDKYFIGVAASVENGETIIRFTNEKGELVPTLSPWFEGIDYGTEITIKNK